MILEVFVADYERTSPLCLTYTSQVLRTFKDRLIILHLVLRHFLSHHTSVTSIQGLHEPYECGGWRKSYFLHLHENLT